MGLLIFVYVFMCIFWISVILVMNSILIKDLKKRIEINDEDEEKKLKYREALDLLEAIPIFVIFGFAIGSIIFLIILFYYFL